MPTEVERLRNSMHTLSTAIAAFAEATADYRRLLEAVVRQASDVIHDSCIMMLREPSDELIAGAVHDPDPALRAELEVVFARPLAGKGIPTYDALISGEARLVPHVELAAMQRCLPATLYELYARIGLRGMLIVPMRVRGEVIGVLAILRHRPERRVLDDLDLELAQDLANHAGLAIANAQLVDQLREQEQLRAANHALIVANQRAEAAKDELESFSYSVAHDLRAPLRGIDGFAQALLEDYGDKLDAEGHRYLDRVRDGAQRMAGLIDDLLALSRVTRAEFLHERIDLGALATTTMARLQREEPGRHVDVVIARGLIATGDPHLMQIAFENLFANAWKFTAKTPAARIELGYDAATRRFFVRDNGAGFDPKYAHKLFGVFQRLHTEAQFPGTGIGLATVARIIARHDGQVAAEGEIDKGATFYFTLHDRETYE